jgi:2-polyprenyl-3-methyl-5-hydroxy-6-metoxy-1,4-benzoquinol methylase
MKERRATHERPATASASPAELRPVPPLVDAPGAASASAPSAAQHDLVAHLEDLATTHEDDFRASSLAVRLYRHNVGSKVLDAGCGTGLLSLELLRRGCDVTAVDHEPSMVAVSSRTFARGGFPDVAAQRMSLGDLGALGRASFDTVYCCDVVEHVEDDGHAMRELASLVRPGGRLVITVPAWQFLYGERDVRMGHFRRYGRRQLADLVRATPTLELESVRWWNVSGFVLNALGRKVLRLKFSEKFRYERKTSGAKLRAKILNRWFHVFENNVPVPCGLTLIAVARRS